MEDFLLPEMIQTTLKTLKVRDLDKFAWNLHHSERQISVTLTWTKTRAKPKKNGRSHFRGLAVKSQPPCQASNTNDSTTPNGHHQPGNSAVLDNTIIMPPQPVNSSLIKPKRRHKTPSQYRRDQRRRREFRANKRLNKNTSTDKNLVPEYSADNTQMPSRDTLHLPPKIEVPNEQLSNNSIHFHSSSQQQDIPLYVPPTSITNPLAPVPSSAPTLYLDLDLHMFDPLFSQPQPRPGALSSVNDPGGGVMMSLGGPQFL